MPALPLEVSVPRLDQLIGVFLSYLKAEVEAQRRKPLTLDYYKRELEAWEVCLPAGILLGQLKMFHLTGAGGHRRHRCQVVKRLFAWAVDQEYIGANPFARVKLPRAGRRSRIFDDKEGARFLRALNRGARWLLIFMRHSCARPGEIRALRWEHFQPLPPEIGEDGIARPIGQFVLTENWKGKGRRKDGATCRVIPADAILCRYLAIWQRRRSPSPGDLIFTSRRGQAWTKEALRCAVRVARRKAGLNEAGRERVVAYTMRHTTATRLTAAGMRDRALADVMGHASTEMTARYQHLETEQLCRTVEGIRLKLRRAPRPRRKVEQPEAPNLFSEVED